MTPDHHAIVLADGARGVPTARPSPGGGQDDAGTSDGPPDATERARSHDRHAAPGAQDYPTPRAVGNRDVHDWFEDAPLVDNLAGLGRKLARSGDLYRNPAYAGGLLLALPGPHAHPTPVTDAAALDAVITDRQRVRVVKGGNIKGWSVPPRSLRTMLASEAFLQQFPTVDVVERASRYLPDFSLSRPGYNDGGHGQRVLHYGAEPHVEFGRDAVERFLDVMAFATSADRTNAVAAALTVMLRNHWPGGKPCLVVTSTKSHGGKETVVAFAAGTTRKASVSYERADWALQKAVVAALKLEPDIGLVDVENARPDGGRGEIRSAFLERFLTDPEPLVYSPGTGAPVRRTNDVVFAITTNFGTVSGDLHNRALPVHLDRVSPVGNSKLEYLPENRDRIEAELRGMVESWKSTGRPTDDAARHPFGPWARTVGGILLANGFKDFLGNYGERKTADDPLRRGLGLLGEARSGEWLRAGEWAALARDLGLAGAVIPEADRGTDLGRERGIGAVLSAHRGETFHVETEDRRLALKLEKARRRFVEGEQPQTRYRFGVSREEEIPEDMSV